VFFELGIRTALDRTVCLVRDDLTQVLPFDTGIIHCHTYRAALNAWHVADDVEALANHIRAAINRSDGRNALWSYFGLTQRGSDAIASVEDKSVAATLDLLLTEMREMKRNARSAPHRGQRFVVQGELADRSDRFVRAAESVAAEVSAPLAVQSATDERIVFDLEEYILDDERREQIAAIGRAYGFDVSFVNGSTTL
jgi:hypothetical protein